MPRKRKANDDPHANKSARACPANGETSTSGAAPSAGDLDDAALGWKAAVRAAYAAVTITGACCASEGAPLRLTARVCTNLSTRAGTTVDLTTVQLLALLDPQFISVTYGRDETADPFEKTVAEEWLLRLQFAPEQAGKQSSRQKAGSFKKTKPPANLQLLVAQRLQLFEAKVDAFVGRHQHCRLALPPLSGKPSIEPDCPIGTQKRVWDSRPVTVLNLLEYLQTLEGCDGRMCPPCSYCIGCTLHPPFTTHETSPKLLPCAAYARNGASRRLRPGMAGMRSSWCTCVSGPRRLLRWSHSVTQTSARPPRRCCNR